MGTSGKRKARLEDTEAVVGDTAPGAPSSRVHLGSHLLSLYHLLSLALLKGSPTVALGLAGPAWEGSSKRASLELACHLGTQGEPWVAGGRLGLREGRCAIRHPEGETGRRVEHRLW